MDDGIGKAHSYGKYEIFEGVEVTTWEQAEALALQARGKKVKIPEPRAAKLTPTVDRLLREELGEPIPKAKIDQILKIVEPESSPDRLLLNRALILLIHLRERIFKSEPQIEKWVNEILDEARSRS